MNPANPIPQERPRIPIKPLPETESAVSEVIDEPTRRRIPLLVSPLGIEVGQNDEAPELEQPEPPLEEENTSDNPISSTDTLSASNFTERYSASEAKDGSRENGDSVIVGESHVILCDGAGGGGEAGSDHQASEYTSKWFDGQIKNIPEEIDPQELANSMNQIYESYFTDPKTAEELSLGGYTTLSIVVQRHRPDGTKYVLGMNIGDSRVYRLKPDGTFDCLTLDKFSELSPEDPDLRKKSEEMKNRQRDLDNFDTPAFMSVQAHPQYKGLKKTINNPKYTQELYDEFGTRNKIVSAIGSQRAGRPQFYVDSSPEGSVYVIVSDGVSDQLTYNEIAQLVTDNRQSTTEMGKRIVERASEISSILRDVNSSDLNIRTKPDDISCAAVRC